MQTNLILTLLVIIVGSIGYAAANIDDVPSGYLDGEPNGWSDRNDELEERLEYLEEQTAKETERIMKEYQAYKDQLNNNDVIDEDIIGKDNDHNINNRSTNKK